MSVRQDRAGWAATLRKMAALGAKGTSAEFSAALEYLATQFPATELPRVNVNTATAIALESGLTLKRSLPSYGCRSLTVSQAVGKSGCQWDQTRIGGRAAEGTRLESAPAE